MLAVAIFIQFNQPAILANFQNRVFDFYQQWSPRKAPSPRQVAVVDIDEKSLAALGQWPWPRSYLAKFVRNATRMNAVVIGFDVIFAEQDRLSPANLAQNVENLNPVLQRQLATLPLQFSSFREPLPVKAYNQISLEV